MTAAVSPELSLLLLAAVAALFLLVGIVLLHVFDLERDTRGSDEAVSLLAARMSLYEDAQQARIDMIRAAAEHTSARHVDPRGRS